LLRVYTCEDAGMVLAGLALTYTTPWDNFLVYKGIWSYPKGRVLMSLGWVPVEEYSFFVIQTAFTCLWFLTVLERQVREARARGGADTAYTWMQACEGDVCVHFCLSLITRGLTHARSTYSYMQAYLLAHCVVVCYDHCVVVCYDYMQAMSYNNTIHNNTQLTCSLIVLLYVIYY